MSAQALWIIAALVVLGAEMLLGTLYLLAIFVGCLAATLCAYLDFSFTTQCLTAGVVTCLGTLAALLFRRRIRRLNTNRDPDSNDLDKGQRIRVTEVTPEGLGRVSYRGSQWLAETEQGVLTPGYYQIIKVKGPRLILGPKLSD
ncbi:MAG: NfeD family protein [Succinivibrio sp.]|nr:NfeD family protein [Succinivibrio sp.]